MSVEILVYDQMCKSLKLPFDASTVDANGYVLDSGICGKLGPEWGVKLGTGGGNPDVYGIVVQDSAGRYSPFTASDFNGVPGGRIDAVMTLVPTSGTGQPPASFGDVGPYIAGQPGWDESEKAAARRLVAAFILASQFRDADDQWTGWLEKWGDQLRAIGIRPDLVLAAKRELTSEA